MGMMQPIQEYVVFRKTKTHNMNNIRSILTAVLVVFATGLFAQKTEIRELKSFEKLAVHTSGNVYLTQGTEQRVELRGDDELLQSIVTDVEGGKLTIRTNKNSWFGSQDKLDVYITMPEVRSITLSGSARLKGENTFKSDEIKLAISGSGSMSVTLEASQLDLAISGSGRMDLDGSANEAKIAISGSGGLKAENLKAKDYTIKISGSGSCRIQAEKSIDAHISGSGSVYYAGNPSKVDSHTSGSGKIKKI